MSARANPPAAETTPAAGSAIEAPQVQLRASDSRFDLSGTTLGLVTAEGFQLRSFVPGQVDARVVVEKARHIVALADGRWVGLAEGAGGWLTLVLGADGREQARFTMTENPKRLRLLPDGDALWLASDDGLVRYPLRPIVPNVYVADQRAKKAPRPIGLAPWGPDALAAVSGSELLRLKGGAEDARWPLPAGLATPVRLADAGEGALWLAPASGLLRRVRVGATVEETLQIPTTGTVFSLASGGGRVAWLELVERGPAQPGTWTLKVAGPDGALLLSMEQPPTGKRAFEDAEDRDLRLSPDGGVVAVGGASGARMWRVADGVEI